jgi:hypothetical protein
MGKLALKHKKEVRTILTDSLHETIKTLGVSKSGKKVEKILAKTSRKLAAEVVNRIKRELKKMHKVESKVRKEKKVNHHEPVAA